MKRGEKKNKQTAAHEEWIAFGDGMSVHRMKDYNLEWLLSDLKSFCVWFVGFLFDLMGLLLLHDIESRNICLLLFGWIDWILNAGRKFRVEFCFYGTGSSRDCFFIGIFISTSSSGIFLTFYRNYLEFCREILTLSELIFKSSSGQKFCKHLKKSKKFVRNFIGFKVNFLKNTRIFDPQKNNFFNSNIIDVELNLNYKKPLKIFFADSTAF